MDPPVINLVDLDSEESVAENIVANVDPLPEVVSPITIQFPEGLSRRRSLVWKHFTLEQRQNNKGEFEEKAVCKYCNKCFGAKSRNGTSSLRKHALRCLQPLSSEGPNSNHRSEFGNNHFKPEQGGDKVEGELKAIAMCKYCKRDFDGRSNNGTSNLRRHGQKCVDVPKQKRQKTLFDMNFKVISM